MSAGIELTWAALALLFALAIWFAKKSNLPLVNPATAYMGPWLLIISVCLVPGAISPQLTGFVPLLALLGALSVIAGAILAPMIPLRPVAGRSMEVSARSLRKIHIVLVLLLVGYVVMQVAQAWPIISSIGGFEAIWSATGSQFRTAQRLARVQQLASGGSIFQSVLGYILFCGHASLVTGGLLWRFGRRVAASMPVVVLLVYTLLTLERTTFAIGTLILLFSVVGARFAGIGATKGARGALGSGVTRVVLAAAALSALLIPLYIRNRSSANSTGLTSLLQYTMSGVVGLNTRSPELDGWSVPVDSVAGTTGDVPGLGAYTFYSLFDVLRRAGLPLSYAPPSADYSPVVILGEQFNTNVATLLADFYYDLGWPGIVLGCVALGFAAALALRLVIGGRTWWLGVYAVLMAAIAWSTFGNAVLTDTRYLLVCIVSAIAIRRSLVGSTRTDRVRGNG